MVVTQLAIVVAVLLGLPRDLGLQVRRLDLTVMSCTNRHLLLLGGGRSRLRDVALHQLARHRRVSEVAMLVDECLCVHLRVVAIIVKRNLAVLSVRLLLLGFHFVIV